MKVRRLNRGRFLLYREISSLGSSSLQWLSLRVLHVHVGDLANAAFFASHLRKHTVPTNVVAEDRYQYAYKTAI